MVSPQDVDYASKMRMGKWYYDLLKQMDDIHERVRKGESSMVVEIMKMSDSKIPRVLKILVYGPPGSGKTTIISTAPGPVLILVLESKVSLASLKDKDVDVIEVNSWGELEEAYAMIKDGKLDEKYKTIGLDGLTEASEMLATKIRKDKNRETLSIQDYTTVQNRLEGLVKAFRSLDCNFILTALIRREENDEQTARVLPDTIGRYRERVVAHVNIAGVIGRIENSETGHSEYRVRLQNGPVAFMAANSCDCKGIYELEAIEPADISLWCKKVFGEEKE